jgi:3-hydroxymyristoyl/3-hydroxydecanoyl-(acyl carrier protein) dehydratase
MIEAPGDIAVERLLPHRRPMLAVDRLEAFSANLSRASLRLCTDSPGFEEGRFRAIFCVELMAQAVAAGVAYGAAASGAPREVAGFVVGVENVRLGSAGSLAPGDELTAESRLEFDIPPATEHTVRLLKGATEIASANLRMLVGAQAPSMPLRSALGAGSLEIHGSRAKILVGAEHPYLAGHFPGLPILPAVGQLRFVEQVAAITLGRSCTLSEIDRARFVEPIAPGDSLDLALELGSSLEISWIIERQGRSVARGRGRLSPG